MKRYSLVRADVSYLIYPIDSNVSDSNPSPRCFGQCCCYSSKLRSDLYHSFLLLAISFALLGSLLKSLVVLLIAPPQSLCPTDVRAMLDLHVNGILELMDYAPTAAQLSDDVLSTQAAYLRLSEAMDQPVNGSDGIVVELRALRDQLFSIYKRIGLTYHRFVMALRITSHDSRSLVPDLQSIYYPTVSGSIRTRWRHHHSRSYSVPTHLPTFSIYSHRSFAAIRMALNLPTKVPVP